MIKSIRSLALAAVAGLLFATAAVAAPAQTAPAKGGAPGVSAPATVAPTPTPIPTAPAAKVNLNDPGLTVDQLDTLPGIGEPRAKAILASRADKGAFIAKDDLVKRGIIPQNVFDGLKDRIALVDVNNTCEADLKAILDGIGDGRAADWIAARKKTPFKTTDAVQAAAGIPPATFAKLAHELTVTPLAKKPWSCMVK